MAPRGKKENTVTDTVDAMERGLFLDPDARTDLLKQVFGIRDDVNVTLTNLNIKLNKIRRDLSDLSSLNAQINETCGQAIPYGRQFPARGF